MGCFGKVLQITIFLKPRDHYRYSLHKDHIWSYISHLQRFIVLCVRKGQISPPQLYGRSHSPTQNCTYSNVLQTTYGCFPCKNRVKSSIFKKNQVFQAFSYANRSPSKTKFSISMKFESLTRNILQTFAGVRKKKIHSLSLAHSL